MRTLVIDTATTACSIALFDGERLVARAHQVFARGHAERLIPLIASLPDGGRAEQVLVDVGPGSFTGVRVGIAAARALALGWGALASGYSSTALVAAAAFSRTPRPALAVVLAGGHGEVYMQPFSAPPLAATAALASLRPRDALAGLGNLPAIGDGVRWLGSLAPDQAIEEAWPDAADAFLLPPAFRALPPRPIYGRAPDAKPMA